MADYAIPQQIDVILGACICANVIWMDSMVALTRLSEHQSKIKGSLANCVIFIHVQLPGVTW